MEEFTHNRNLHMNADTSANRSTGKESASHDYIPIHNEYGRNRLTKPDEEGSVARNNKNGYEYPRKGTPATHDREIKLE